MPRVFPKRVQALCPNLASPFALVSSLQSILYSFFFLLPFPSHPLPQQLEGNPAAGSFLFGPGVEVDLSVIAW